jgi:hypothetical protein
MSNLKPIPMRRLPGRACRDCGRQFIPSWPSTVRCDKCHVALKSGPRSCCDCGAKLEAIRIDSRRCNKCHELRSRPVVLVCGSCGVDFERPKKSRATACSGCRAYASQAKRRSDNQEWRLRNPEKRAAQNKRYKERHRKKVRAYKRGYDNKTRRGDYRVKLISIVRSRVANALKVVRDRGRVPASRGAWRFVGCTLGELVAHLESQFAEGMSWSNFGRGGWHVDHMFPVAKADLTDNAQLLAAFNWRNCRPAWETENLRKSARVSAAARRHFEGLVATFRAEAGPPRG